MNELENDFATSYIPIILLSAKSSIESRIEGLKYGDDAYVTKPLYSQYFKACVLNLLEQRKLLLMKFTSQVRVLDISRNEIIITDKDNEFIKTVVGVIEENSSNTDFKIEKTEKSLGLVRPGFFKKVKGLTSFPEKLVLIDDKGQIRFGKNSRF